MLWCSTQPWPAWHSKPKPPFEGESSSEILNAVDDDDDYDDLRL